MLVKFINDQIDMPMYKISEVISTGETTPEIDEAGQRLQEVVTKGDEALPDALRNDVEEARLYQKRYSSPMEALREAKKVYEFTDDDVMI